ncbi:TPA: GrpB family protein [Klebsiella pneumoniae]|uniref:GrpB family protein n=1 Tax=Klebsiella pneumoniae TaxID=573 RepID=UPI00397596F4|nr:GrpB family protein [Klebsiella pneumoniae]
MDPQDSYFVNGIPPIENVAVVAYTPPWPEIYSALESKIKNKLGSTLLKIAHVDSTSAPGLAAKFDVLHPGKDKIHTFPY